MTPTSRGIFFEFKAKNVGIALVTARLFNAEIGKKSKAKSWFICFAFLSKLLISYPLQFIITFSFLFFGAIAVAQTDSVVFYLGSTVYMDSITVSASRTGFDAEDFIEMVQTDESFYRAFKNIRTLSYSADNEILIKDKKGNTKATYASATRQQSDGDCREMTVAEKTVTGNFYEKKGAYRYYTAKLFDRVFYTHGRVCESAEATAEKPSGLEKQYAELKKLIFSPGQEADVPFIGKKTAIFSEDMQPYYHFSIRSAADAGGRDCYVFTAQVRPEFKEDRTVIKFLETWFAKDDFQITARNYRLQYYGLAFDFAVEMRVKIKALRDRFVPERIEYQGFFDIPFKKPEYGNFTVRLFDFE